MTSDPARPETYPQRVLVVATGMSPQVVTETLYVLAVREPAWVPTEIRLVTTRKGADIAERDLLHGEGWLHRLRRDYELPPIDFNAERIHTLSDSDGVPLDDIQTPADNTAAADAITQVLCELTQNDASALHVSIAGGRKTMGFYVGYALSLYGRRQDRLSHVLVNPPYESLPEFFYPTPTEMIVKTRDGCLVNARDADVSLAEIPFVRLREGLPEDLEDLQEGKISFHAAVEAAQRAIGPVELVIDLPGKRVRAGGRVFHLPPLQLAFLAWLARRRKKGLEWLRCPADGAPEHDYGMALMREYNAIVGPMGANDRTAQRLKAGMDASFFSQTKTKLHKSLKDALDRREVAAYKVAPAGRQPTVYGLDIDPKAIRFEALAP